jgi:hypothetical protein
MPKTRLDRYAKPKMPPVDLAWGAVLARKEQLGLDLKELAQRAGLSYDYTRKVFSMGSPAVWPPDTRDKILEALGLRARLVIEDAEE